MKIFRKIFPGIIICFLILALFTCKKANELTPMNLPTGSVIFIHPDGSGAAMWAGLRMLDIGPDGMLNWDHMERLGVYRGHLANSVSSSSNGGATTHAYGVKATYQSYGTYNKLPITSLSGKNYSIMMEAKKAGKAVALINSGHLCEPGTGAFVASYPNRQMTDTISYQIIHSGADIILSGGETLLLPEGEMGRHGEPGIRKDGRNLIEEAINLGYSVVYTHDELKNISVQTEKLLGVFAPRHTFNDKPEEVLQRENLPLYFETSPSTAEMTEIALKILEAKGKDFMLVVEEEGTDNFSNANNATGAFEALRRADAAIGAAIQYIERHPSTLLITAADSDAGGMQMLGIRDSLEFGKPLPPQMYNGAPLDGRNGTYSLPFITAPDKSGNRLFFGVCWAGTADLNGGVIAKAHGLNASFLPKNVDNTDIYRIMYATLFGIWLE
ncbi:MAG: alkaline phosphatase [Calditrichaeota bacterium]|nr:alkaline phosphatase [Calditrichota bacterium]RQV92765.1 MAG: alkaline phosphatase [bacterium]